MSSFRSIQSEVLDVVHVSAAGLDRRFFETTRGKIVALLRRGSHTVEELAAAVGLTDNAVRSHLSTLERDGLVRQGGLRRLDGPGKPANVYEVHPDAVALFSRAYAPVLRALVEELAVQMAPSRSAELMQAVGRRLSADSPRSRAEDTLDVRMQAGAALLNSLGGDAHVEKRDGSIAIRGSGCPLSVATARRPELCGAVEALLGEVIGVAVRETCVRGDRPQCCFQVAQAS